MCFDYVFFDFQKLISRRDSKCRCIVIPTPILSNKSVLRSYIQLKRGRTDFNIIYSKLTNWQIAAIMGEMGILTQGTQFSPIRLV